MSIDVFSWHKNISLDERSEREKSFVRFKRIKFYTATKKMSKFWVTLRLKSVTCLVLTNYSALFSGQHTLAQDNSSSISLTHLNQMIYKQSALKRSNFSGHGSAVAALLHQFESQHLPHRKTVRWKVFSGNVPTGILSKSISRCRTPLSLCTINNKRKVNRTKWEQALSN